MIALAPLVSWFLVLVVLFIAIVVYAAVVAGGRADEWAERMWRGIDVLPPANVRPEDAPPSGGPPWVRVLPSVYDWQTREDFHDPIRDHEWCADCNARLRRAFNDLADLDLGPRDVDALMARIREVLDS